MENSSPFIHLFRSPRFFYFYDAGLDAIVPVSGGIYAYLEGKKEYGSLGEEDRRHLDALKENGFLSSRRMETIRHPADEHLEHLLDSCVQQLVLQVTQSCNLSCSYCPYANRTDGILQRNPSDRMMDAGTAKAAIDFYRAHSRDAGEAVIAFYGGEPLIAFDLIRQAVQYAEETFQDRPLTFSMTTNGTLLTEKQLRFLAAHHFRLTFSIDGPAPVHDRNRRTVGGRGSFAAAFARLKQAAAIYGEEGEPLLSINMVMDPEYPAEEVFGLFRDPWMAAHPRIGLQATAAQDDELVHKFRACEEYRQEIEYQYFLGYLKYLRIVRDAEPARVTEAYFEALDKKYLKYKTPSAPLPERGAPAGPCIPGVRRMFVDAGGDIFPCEKVSEVASVMKIGSIRTGFDVPAVRRLLNVGALTPERCRNCYAAAHCQICASDAECGDHLDPEKKLKSCEKTLRYFEEELQNMVMIREYRTYYGRKQHEDQKQ